MSFWTGMMTGRHSESMEQEQQQVRLRSFALGVAQWIVFWTLCVVLADRGASGKNHVILLNFLHGVICTCAATVTLLFATDATQTIAISVGYFIVDGVAMCIGDRDFARWRELSMARYLEYVHHLMGIGFGVYLFAKASDLCDVRMGGNPYVWIQTNELSTPFYAWVRWTNTPLAGFAFAWTFFLSRILFNSAVVLPKAFQACHWSTIALTSPFFVLQYMWFGVILLKIKRVLSPETREMELSKRLD